MSKHVFPPLKFPPTTLAKTRLPLTAKAPGADLIRAIALSIVAQAVPPPAPLRSDEKATCAFMVMSTNMSVQTELENAMPDADVTKLPIVNNMSGPLADRVYTALKSAIMAMDVPPGAFIRKSALCDYFGLSRSPVTDALAKLSVEGLVDIVPQSGTRVARLSMQAVREDVFLRECLEVAAASHAARNRPDGIVARLNRNIEMQKLLVADGDIDEFMRTDIAFHQEIMATTGVSRLPNVVRTVSPSVDRARKLLMPEPGRMADTVDEHIKVAAAIQQQDETAAAEAMRYHVCQVLQRLEPLEAARPDLFSK